MAGSRLEYVGTIFSRTTGLLRTKAIKYEDRPIWYDIYRVFPPKFEPRADRQPELSDGMTQEVPTILYNEDISRAALFKKFGKNPGGKVRNLMYVAGSFGQFGEEEDATKRFILKYNEMMSAHGDWTPEQIVESISQQFVGKFGSGGGLRSRRPQPERMVAGEETREPEGMSVSESMIGTSKPASRRFASSSMHDEDDVGDEVLDNSEGEERRKRTQRPIVTVDTLISMFKKAKEKDDPDKDKT